MRLFLKLAILLVILTVQDASAKEPVYVRVAIIQDASSVRVKIKGFFEVRGGQASNIIYKGNSINTTATAYNKGVLLGDIKSDSDKLFIKCEDAREIYINNRLFRGNIQLVKTGNSKLLVVNHIQMQDYIKGILYNEISHYWPVEALKAQAIVSRTFALYQMQESRSKNFDVTSDIYSQVYGGKFSERYRTSKAVDDTNGQVLFYKGKIFPAYFHATCGGVTEDAFVLWNIDLVPLKGGVCGFCKESPHYIWHGDISLKEMQDKLNQAGFKVGSISNILIDGRNKSGRITNIKIISGDTQKNIPPKDFRIALGPNFIKSLNFNVSVAGWDAVFEGIGWGHGIGLCQWGAYFMAKRGDSAEKILKHYYPGAYVKAL
jgi:stage II sporulation protein D